MSFFDKQLQIPIADDHGRIIPFNPGTIRMIDIAFKGEMMSVPIFMRFFRRSSKPRECVVCTESHFDIDLGSKEEWSSVCKEDLGDGWMWNLLFFPAAAMMNGCAHEFDTCKQCLGHHITTQLEQLGRAGCDRVSCPTLECGRVFDHNEVRRLAPEETFNL